MKYVQESMYSNMHTKNNESNNNKRSVLANKIGAIVSAACGTAAITASRNIAFGFGKEFNGGNDERPVSASSKTQGHANALKCMEVSSRRRPIAVASTLSGILTRKWKTSLRRVKVRLKRDVKTKTEAKSEMELCKKRILMGEKCRALNLSGVLHYDKQGILLPED